MAFGKRIGLSGLKYKGGGPMIAWLFHRIGGLAMVIFIGTHILASFSNQQLGNDLGAQLNVIYTSWPFQAVLYFFVIFHTLNGLRIILLDLWPQFLKYQREATWVVWILFIPLYGMVLYFMVANALAGG
jgi:succinate dehydrogenase / fumarate reductase cytochrome b subunit